MDLINYANIETFTRNGFIKVIHILAKGISLSDRKPLVISITGQMDVGKALVADAMINALNENPETKKYDVPFSVKMAFESAPAQAAHFPVRGFIIIDGERVPAYFVRQVDNLEMVKKKMDKGIIFYSDKNILESADIHIDISSKVEDKNGAIERNQWQRDWSIKVLNKEIVTEKMFEMLSHLNSVRASQSHRKSMDI